MTAALEGMAIAATLAATESRSTLSTAPGVVRGSCCHRLNRPVLGGGALSLMWMEKGHMAIAATLAALATRSTRKIARGTVSQWPSHQLMRMRQWHQRTIQAR